MSGGIYYIKVKEPILEICSGSKQMMDYLYLALRGITEEDNNDPYYILVSESDLPGLQVLKNLNEHDSEFIDELVKQIEKRKEFVLHYKYN